MMQRTAKSLLSGLLALSVYLMAGVTHAITVDFTNITNNTGVNLTGQITAEIDQTGNEATIKILNDGSIDSDASVTRAYFDFDWGSVSSIGIYEESAGVDFEALDPLTNLPGGNPVGFSVNWGAGAEDPTYHNGVNSSSEYITFLATLSEGFDLLSAIYNETFKIGLHVQGIGFDNEGSDSYVSQVPVPAAAWLFGSALIGFVATSRRRRKLEV